MPNRDDTVRQLAKVNGTNGLVIAGPKLGDRWGRLRVIETGWVDREVQTSEATWVTVKIAVYVLLCDCGREVSVLQPEWTGKRDDNNQDCGKCGLNKQDGPLGSMTVYLNAGQIERVNRWAKNHNCTASETIRELVWLVWRDNQGRQRGQLPDGWLGIIQHGGRMVHRPVPFPIQFPVGLKVKLELKAARYQIKVERVIVGLVMLGLRREEKR